MEKRKSKPEHMLMEAIGFTEEDLRQNREGALSERQRTLLNQTQFPSKLKLLGFTLIFILMGAFLGILRIWSEYGSLSLVMIRFDPGLIFGATIIVGSFGLMGVWLAAQSLITRRNIQIGKVSKVTGKVKPRVTKTKGGMSYQLFIGRTKFYIDEKIYMALSDEQAYDVYFLKTPISNIILSVEGAQETEFWH